MKAELYKIIKSQCEKYPLLTPCDAVKLVYQNEYGGGHMVGDEAVSLLRLRTEYAVYSQYENKRTFDDIGNGLVRLNLLSPLVRQMDLNLVNKMFVHTANNHTGDINSFKEKLDCLLKMAKNDLLPFTYTELDAYLKEYAAESYPPVSHSDIYRENYKPCYRLVFAAYLRLLPLIIEIEKLLKQKENVVVAIDGMAASGKTTAARLIKTLFDCNLIHMDDFFLPPELRTAKRYAETGGNVHYERFNEEVAEGIRGGGSYSYRIFDCSLCDYSKTTTNSPKTLTLVEGAYALHPLFEDIYDIKVFSGITKDEQKRRILVRNGEDGLVNFLEKWIPLEDSYIDKYSIKEKCDLIL